MKLFSTISCEAPVTLNIIERTVIIKIAFLSCKMILAVKEGKEKVDFLLSTAGVFLSSISRVGKTINEMINENVIPALIIHPRFITGWIWEKRSEEKPAMVVMMA